MRTTISIDDELYQTAAEYSGPGKDRATVVREAMETYVRVQAGKRLIALGGSMPDAAEVPRRKPGN